MTQPQALGTLLAQTNPKHLNGGTKSLQTQSCIWPQFPIRPLTHNLGAAVQQNSLLLQADTMPNLQQLPPSQPSKPNSPSAITSVGQAPLGALPRLPRARAQAVPLAGAFPMATCRLAGPTPIDVNSGVPQLPPTSDAWPHPAAEG